MRVGLPIIGGVRFHSRAATAPTPTVGNQEMLTAMLRGLVERYGLQGQRLDEVAAGAVIKHSSQWNLTRESLLDSGLAAETPGLDLQRACGTSLEAAILIGNKIALGQIDSGIAAGVDTVSDPAGRLSEALSAAAAEELSRQERRQRLRPWLGLRPHAFSPGAARHGRAAHRAFDGREHRAHGEALGDQPRASRTSSPRQPPEGRRRLCRRVLRRSGARVSRA